MVVLAFDTLAYAKKLEKAGMPAEQAEVQAEALKSVVDGQAVALATKEDVERETQTLGAQFQVAIQEAHSELKAEIQQVHSEIQEVRSDLKGEIQEVRSDLKGEIQEVRSELKGEIQQVHSEIQEVRSELKGEIQEVRSDLKSEIQEVRVDLKVLDTRMRAFEKIGWAVVLGVLALLVKAFLPPLAGG